MVREQSQDKWMEIHILCIIFILCLFCYNLCVKKDPKEKKNNVFFSFGSCPGVAASYSNRTNLLFVLCFISIRFSIQFPFAVFQRSRLPVASAPGPGSAAAGRVWAPGNPSGPHSPPHGRPDYRPPAVRSFYSIPPSHPGHRSVWQNRPHRCTGTVCPSVWSPGAAPRRVHPHRLPGWKPDTGALQNRPGPW